ncbi:hypothetical protein [Terriglobus tenax]|uniref:hypothetical protein n=1 Tax=Terriglobus tenax TaxID=1111115 RepID=UPI0021E0D129|nr:hypothetical protein [Terriglobus tenax]
MQTLLRALFPLLLLPAMLVASAQQPRHVTLSSLPQNTRDLFRDSMHWDEYFWDSSASLIRSPYFEAHKPEAFRHMVRESSWYALGLLLRDQPGDRKRAAAVIDAVLQQQYTDPSARWFGTWKRSPEEPTPGPNAELWKDYDPNWRIFIGTTFAIMLTEYTDRLPASLRQRMYHAIEIALQGEMQQQRLVPSYTNIALMYGFLYDFASMHNGKISWARQAAAWNISVYQLFQQSGTFPEYNSPTYGGVDLYGLALWRDYGSTAQMRRMGATMEQSLWREIASFYQPDLRNLSGPFDRAYGMDMTEYVSVAGVWMRSVMPASSAPLPSLSATTDHLPDIWFAPHIAILGTNIPPDALTKLQHFPGPHAVRQSITPQRVATAWVGKDILLGGESTTKTLGAGASSQFHPVTIHWRMPSGHIGWVQLIECPPVDAVADEHGISIDTSGTVRLRIHAPGLSQQQISATLWKLPGLDVAVTGSQDFHINQGEDFFDLTYASVHHMRLEVATR